MILGGSTNADTIIRAAKHQRDGFCRRLKSQGLVHDPFDSNDAEVGGI
jgi:hypothetical protein